MNFEFDKFVKDLEKRDVSIKEKRNIAKHIIEEDERRRRRSELYHERWQNRIKWENTNGK